MNLDAIFMRIFGISVLLMNWASCLGIIKDLLQYNVAGVPVLHKTIPFPFDPEEGARKSVEYQQKNGKFGEKLIERIGLGNDENERLRLEQQKLRDEGQLGGVREYVFR